MAHMAQSRVGRAGAPGRADAASIEHRVGPDRALPHTTSTCRAIAAQERVPDRGRRHPAGHPLSGNGPVYLAELRAPRPLLGALSSLELLTVCNGADRPLAMPSRGAPVAEWWTRSTQNRVP